MEKKRPYNYQEAEKVLIVHDDDPDLVPVEIELPDAPPLETIDGYGLAPEDQVFTPPVFPAKLMMLQKKYSTIEQCFSEIRKNKEYYSEEIKFIQNEWKKRMNGYWFFNNGLPTYIAGVHYFYLVYWHHGRKRPDYRSRDRKFYLFLMMCLLDKFCCGFNYPKFRREGATSKVACFIYWLCSMEMNKHYGIQSKDEDSASEVFIEHIVNSHKKIMFWFKPRSRGKADPQSKLEFKSVSETISKKGTNLNVVESLESFIDFGTSTAGYYDRAKLRVHYGDEEGKTLECDVYDRFNKIKPTLQDGNTYIGFHIATTTVGEMVKGGGEKFQEKVKHSMFHERGSDGETTTGLYNLFISSIEGLNIEDKKTDVKFIDKYGNSDKDKIKKYLEDKRADYLKSGDLNGYNEFVRQFPIYLRECFRASAGGCHFDEKILMDRIEEFRFGNPHKIRGDFHWKDKNWKDKDFFLKPDTEVVFTPSSKGRWWVSWYPPQNLSNRSINVYGVKVPAMKHTAVAGGDPFKVNDAKYHRSNGGGAIYRKFDMSADDINSDPMTWKTDNFCATYSYRPDTVDEYCEDMLMACIYYGIEMFPEINVDALLRHFKKRGYPGYLYYQTDIKTGKKFKNAGGYTVERSQTSHENILGAYLYWVANRAACCVHDELLNECLEVRDDMLKFDRFVAGGYALIASTRQDPKPLETVRVQPYHRKFQYGK